MNGTQDYTVTRGDSFTIGNSQYYTRGIKPTATAVTIGDEMFLEINGTLYAQCGWCDAYGTKTFYRGVYDGVCFQCGGRGYGREVGTVEAATKRVHNRELRQARAARKAAEEAAAAAKAGADWRAANPALAEMGEAIYAELAEANDSYTYEIRDALEAKWSDNVLHLANQVGMGRPLTATEGEALAAGIAKALDRQAAEEARQAASRHYGTEGGKVAGATGVVKLAFTKEVESFSGYGTDYKRFVIIEGTGDYAGVTFKIFGTGKTLFDTERGDVVEVKGGIKAHGEYEGIKQTELTRATIKVVSE